MPKRQTKKPRRKRFLPFGEARAFVRSLGLAGKAEWEAWRRGDFKRTKGRRPDTIPSNPDQVYPKRWAGWGDFLGTGNIAPKDRRYLSFAKARAYVRQLCLQSAAEWHQWSRGDMPEKGRRPADIPSAPWQVYRHRGWISMGDWLGTGTVCTRYREYRPFRGAREFVRLLGLKSQSQWYAYCAGKFPKKGRKPKDIPYHPHTVYVGNGWQGWGDFLGAVVRPVPRRFRSYEEARRFARSLKLSSASQWRRYVKKAEHRVKMPEDIPLSPDRAYRNDGWVSWGDFLGVAHPRQPNMQWRSYQEARAWVRALNLSGESKWRQWVKDPENRKTLPVDIPLAPAGAYRGKGWISWPDFLGNGRASRKNPGWRSFEDARAFARSLHINSVQWRPWSKGRLPGKPKRPADIPASPHKVYAGKGWISWADFLGTGSPPRPRVPFKPFKEARAFAQSLNLTSRTWFQWCNGAYPEKGPRPPDIPAHPDTTYRNKGWRSWSDFLGTRRHLGWRSFKKAQAFAHSLHLKSCNEWRRWCKGEIPQKPPRPNDIPAAPHQVYEGKGWTDWYDFLGNQSRGNQR